MQLRVLEAPTPAREGRDCGTPDRPNSPHRGSESANIGTPHHAIPGAGGAAHSSDASDAQH
eukprot:2621646-Alexandrium_andersonii.AAC.1